MLRDLSKAHGLTLSEIAAKAGLVPSTLTRFYNDPDNTSLLGGATMAKLEAAFAATPPGFGEPDAELLRGQDGFEGAVLTPNQSIWRVGKGFAAVAGFRAGDLFLLDMSVIPRDGDDVLANIYDQDGRSARTVLRRFHKGWVFGDAHTDPEYAEGRSVKVMGVVVKSWRHRDG